MRVVAAWFELANQQPELHKAIKKRWYPAVERLAGKTRWSKVTSLYSALAATLRGLNVHMDDLHRFWTCPVLNRSPDPAISESQHLVAK
ncbi:unnamed protein product, partial [Prorocentrum cordatum]